MAAYPAWQATIVTEAGDIQPGAQVDVVLESTGLVPAGGIWSNRAGSSALANPFFADANGFAQFYAAPGEYRITATGVGGTRVWRYVVLDGTASTADVTTSATDTTAGRLLKVGDFGIGDTTADVYTTSDAATNTQDVTAGRVWTTDVLQPAAYAGLGTSILARNISGVGVSAGSSLAAADLKHVTIDSTGAFSENASPLASGTWKNMGAFVGNNGYSTFVRRA